VAAVPPKRTGRTISTTADADQPASSLRKKIFIVRTIEILASCSYLWVRPMLLNTEPQAPKGWVLPQ
jgi:hypothetical protein